MGTQEQHLRGLVVVVASTLERHPDFLRLLIALATRPHKDRDVHTVVDRVRALALDRLRGQFAVVFGIEAEGADAHDLARFALAAFDGAFVAWQASPDVALNATLANLPDALLAIRRGRPDRTPRGPPRRPAGTPPGAPRGALG